MLSGDECLQTQSSISFPCNEELQSPCGFGNDVRFSNDQIGIYNGGAGAPNVPLVPLPRPEMFTMQLLNDENTNILHSDNHRNIEILVRNVLGIEYEYIQGSDIQALLDTIFPNIQITEDPLVFLDEKYNYVFGVLRNPEKQKEFFSRIIRKEKPSQCRYAILLRLQLLNKIENMNILGILMNPQQNIEDFNLLTKTITCPVTRQMLNNLIFSRIGLTPDVFGANGYYIIAETLNENHNLGIDTDNNRQLSDPIVNELIKHFDEINIYLDKDSCNEILIKIYHYILHLKKYKDDKLQKIRDAYESINPDKPNIPLCNEYKELIQHIEQLLFEKLGLEPNNINLADCKVIASTLNKIKTNTIHSIKRRDKETILLEFGTKYEIINEAFQDDNLIRSLIEKLFHKPKNKTGSNYTLRAAKLSKKLEDLPNQLNINQNPNFAIDVGWTQQEPVLPPSDNEIRLKPSKRPKKLEIDQTDQTISYNAKESMKRWEEILREGSTLAAIMSQCDEPTKPPDKVYNGIEKLIQERVGIGPDELKIEECAIIASYINNFIEEPIDLNINSRMQYIKEFQEQYDQIVLAFDNDELMKGILVDIYERLTLYSRRMDNKKIEVLSGKILAISDSYRINPLLHCNFEDNISFYL